MGKILIALVVVLSFGVALQAQSSISSYEIRYYNPGASSPLQVESLPGGSYTCNQVPPVTTITGNPTTAFWDDPQASGRACIYVEVPGGPLLSFPVGNYEAALVAINNFGTSPESARAPFALGGSPGTPTGFHVAR